MELSFGSSIFYYYISIETKTKVMETSYQLPNNRKLIVDNEESPETPRDWDNLTTMVFIGSYSHLGDKHDFHGTHESFEAHQAHIENQPDVVYVAPVYAYVHSGMTISLSPFSCPWDSGKLGWVIITKQRIREIFGVKRVTQKYIDKAIEQVAGEIETLDQYIRGEVYYFKIEDEEGNQEDCCGGFYGDDISENGMLDHLRDKDRKALAELV